MRRTTRGLALAGLLTFSFASAVQAEEQKPNLSIFPPEITMDIPVPVQGGDLALLLAQASQGNSLSQLKEAAILRYKQHLERELAQQLQEFFTDEEILLVDRQGLLSLRNTLDITVIKHFSSLQSKGDHELEKGTVELSGDYRYRLEHISGSAMREQQVNISKLKIREKYQVVTPNDGGEIENTTDRAIERALSELVEELMERIEDDLEADELESFARSA
ncbi:hypothetical protein [Microbulbifer rhizosphaerae]|uniref:Putative house-cleaning noncanonical NTP pyrophosphatase (MazG superfamily) n=1 Tax=Microbulbifer rhizosphaerae TaxID=1562603 RepID=A0A7W4Z9I4_9GAMM|nr:hypothetical protein [Microbulbifer rhizosphaerae]MBB3061616.1 putative house-cleaning noncanonical NTP pyrophosphatase (MazG superfamily) [Microbulbifer rhizosphaerae]